MLFFFIPYCNCWRPFLFSFDTPHCSILKKAWGTLLSCFTFCEQSCEGRFHFFSSPIKNTIQSFLLSFNTGNEVLTKMYLLKLFRVELKFKYLKAFHSQYLANSHHSLSCCLSANGTVSWRSSCSHFFQFILYRTILSKQHRTSVSLKFFHVHMKPTSF